MQEGLMRWVAQMMMKFMEDRQKGVALVGKFSQNSYVISWYLMIFFFHVNYIVLYQINEEEHEEQEVGAGNPPIHMNPSSYGSYHFYFTITPCWKARIYGPLPLPFNMRFFRMASDLTQAVQATVILGRNLSLQPSKYLPNFQLNPHLSFQWYFHLALSKSNAQLLPLTRTLKREPQGHGMKSLKN